MVYLPSLNVQGCGRLGLPQPFAERLQKKKKVMGNEEINFQLSVLEGASYHHVA